jgi:ATP-binding cassette, subfamily C, bacterial exporter for protease/lipase
LKGVSFSVPAGTIVAVIGPSASGKSTLARALVGVWAPLNGAVRLDGADVYKWDKSELGPWLGYLPQDVELFDGTIAENIARFGELDAEPIVAAAQHAGVHDLILRLPQGYDTPIGEGGAVLSGGQRQRIALARALFGDPMLLVLDEPNANLDEAGEAALLNALKYLKANKRTVFVVTHRPNMLNVADSVAVLAGGTLQGYGSVENFRKTLMAKASQTAGGTALSRAQAEGTK